MKTSNAIRRHNRRSAKLESKGLAHLATAAPDAEASSFLAANDAPEIVVSFRELEEETRQETVGESSLEAHASSFVQEAPPVEEPLIATQGQHQSFDAHTDDPSEEDLLGVLLNEINTAFPESLLADLTPSREEVDAVDEDAIDQWHEDSVVNQRFEKHVDSLLLEKSHRAEADEDELSSQANILSEAETSLLKQSCKTDEQLAEVDDTIESSSVESNHVETSASIDEEADTQLESEPEASFESDSIADPAVETIYPQSYIVSDDSQHDVEPQADDAEIATQVTETSNRTEAGVDFSSAAIATGVEASAETELTKLEEQVSSELDSELSEEATVEAVAQVTAVEGSEAEVGSSAEVESLLLQYRQLVDSICERTPAVKSPVLLFGAAKATATSSICVLGIAEELAERSGSRKILLIDGRLEDKQLSKQLGFTDRPGLAESLIESDETSEWICSTDLDNLDFLPAGNGLLSFGRTEPSAILQLTGRWKSTYDYIVIDGGNTQQVMPRLLCPYTDATYLLVSLGKTETASAKTAVTELRAYGARLLGCIACVETESR